MIRRSLPLVVVILLGVCAALPGCMSYSSYSDSVVYDPPLARNVDRIVKGETTHSQILGFFGVPSLEVRGSNVIFHDDSPMGQSWLKSMAKSINGTTLSRSERIKQLLPYSSIDDQHVALLYLESDVQYNQGWIPGMGAAHGAALSNRLLVFIDRRTGVVDEFGYLQEFKAD